MMFSFFIVQETLYLYDKKHSAGRRREMMSLMRPAAGEESCKAGFFFAHKMALPSYPSAFRFSCKHGI